jgi:biotin carboxyl carrier protein
MVNNPLLKTILIGDRLYETRITKKFERRKRWTPPDPSVIRCVIPGVIREIFVAPGQQIDRNSALLVLEAMKMQNEIRSSSTGTVKTVLVQPGQLVSKGDPLVELIIADAGDTPEP